MIVALLSIASLAPQRGTPEVATIALSGHVRVRDLICADLDGDGVRDLALARSLEGKRESGRSAAARTLALHRSRGDGPRFRDEPDQQVEITSDASAFAVGDVHADPGAEIVLFNANGAFALRPSAGDRDRYARLASASFLWQLGDPTTLYAWQEGVADLDGDRRVDLLLPEPGGLRIALQHREGDAATFERSFGLRAPIEPPPPDAERSSVNASGERGSFRLSLDVSGLGAELEAAGPLVAIEESAPAPHARDWDGDGDLDLVLQTSRSLCVFLQQQGAFATNPSLVLPLPVPADRSRRLDASYSSHAVDLDGDARVDCAIFAGDKRSDDVRTQALLFLQGRERGAGALFGERGVPAQLLVIAGFVASASFELVDGDRLPDLVVRSVRPDLIDQLQSISSESIDAELYVFLNRQGALSRNPDLTWRYPVRLRRFEPRARFVGDVDGDRISEIVVRSEPERVAMHAVRATRDRWEVLPKPLWERSIEADAALHFHPREGRDVELTIVESTAVHQVRWR